LIIQNKHINTAIRAISLFIPISIIALLKLKNDSNYFFLTQLVGMGILLSNLVSTEYHTKYMMEHSKIAKKNSFEVDDQSKLNKLWSIYIKKIFLHISLALPLIFLLLRPNNLILTFLLVFFVLGEKIFDELQRFLQIGEIDIPAYTMFLFSRRIIMLLPYLFINLISPNQFLILIMCASLLSNLFAWLIVKGKYIAFRELRGLRSIFDLDFLFVRNFYLKGLPLKQIILSFSLTSFGVLPFLIVSNNVENINEMANFSLFQRLLSMPIIAYRIIFFSANRWELINMASKSKKKLNILFHDSLLIAILVVISFALIGFGFDFYLISLALIQTTTAILLLVPIDHIYWNFALNKKLLFFMPSFGFSLIVLAFISNLYIAVTFYFFVIISLLITSYKKYFKFIK
tara:strand:+ start:1160 stop:2365 length:1206 start_codon:yes stop_codon:yes gene_type:complete